MVKPKVVFRNVYKEYSMLKSNKDKLLDFFLPRKEKTSFFAVKDVSFSVYPGETIGIIGINGSGKSTVSNLLSEVIPPTAGDIEIDGETSLIAISVGLNGQLSGLENIHLKCMMHGMSEEEIKNVTPKIIEFADVGSFIEQPVKSYSSGMKSRLGFAVSVHTNPDVLVVDEALSVGDQTFYDKCMAKINEFKRDGKTIFFVSHSAGQMKKIADRVIWMHYGEIREFGDTKTVTEKYTSFIKWFNRLSENEKKQYKEEMFEKQSAKNVEHQEGLVKKTLSKEEKKEKRIFGIQLGLLSVALLIMMSLMVTGTPIKTAWGKISSTFISDDVKTTPSTEDKNTEMVPEKVNQQGYVITEQAQMFVDKELDKKEQKIDMFEEVYVLEKYEDVFKVKFDSKEYFIKASSITIDENLEELEFTIENFLPYLEDSFTDAYHYYLLYLEKTIEETENDLNGSEIVQIEDEKFSLGLIGNEITYYANKDGENVRLKLSLEQSLPDEMLNAFTDNGIENDDKTKYFAVSSDYDYIVDLKNSDLYIIRKQ